MRVWSCLLSAVLLILSFSPSLAADQITFDPAADSQPCWSPNNDYMAFVSNRSGNSDIWVADLTLSGSTDDFVRAELHGNYPNPFNPSTTISFSLSKSSSVSLDIYDVSGRLVSRLISNQVMGIGTWKASWNGEDSRSRAVPAGVNYYKLTTGEIGEIGSMALV